MRFLPVVAVYLTLCLSASAKAEKYSYSFAGDDSNNPQMFSDPMKTENTILSAIGWKTQILNTTSFNSKTLDQIVKSAKPGDQVMITIDTHGSPDNSGTGHFISCGNQDCDTGKLKKTIQALEQKGVQVAIVDMSCYSGLSQNLKTSKTCIISGATDNDVAWSTFSTNFATNIWPGRSLEDTFLKARLMPTTLGLPQISSQAGQISSSLIEELAKHPTANVDFKSLSKEPCANFDMKQLTVAFSDINDITGKLQASAYVLANSNYKSIYRQAQDLAKELMKMGPETKATSELGLTYTWETLATIDDSWMQKNIPSMYKLKQSLKSNPSFQKFLSLQKKFEDLTNSKNTSSDGKSSSPLADAAFQTQLAEKPLYDRVYKAHRSMSGKANPCAEFTF